MSVVSEKILDVAGFYEGKSVFVTGGTGFMGKVLLEKLLRCCTGLKKIYVLIREKGSDTPEKRLANMFDCALFSRLKKVRPDYSDFTAAVEGDILQSNLGMCDNDFNNVIENVSVIFHCAASVRFQEPLADALNANVRSVDKVLDLVQRMQKLESFVHVSTAYAYAFRKEIEETVYAVKEDVATLMKSTEWMSQEMVEALSPYLVQEHPNTYTYTKSLAENLIVERLKEEKKIHTIIVRPSIVTASWKDPFPGWCDSMNGPVGLIVTFGKGLLRTMLGRRDAVANFMPVDVAINLMIAAPWKASSEQKSNTTIYNCTSLKANSITWGQLSDYISANIKSLPLDNPARIPVYNSGISPNHLRNRIDWLYSHWIPAYCFDFVLRLAFRRPRFVYWYKKIEFMCDCLKYFTMRSWLWENGNVRRLHNAMSESDKKLFFVDTFTLDWKKHIADYHAGVKRHILHESIANVSSTKAWIRARQVFACLFSSFIICYILFYFNPHNLFQGSYLSLFLAFLSALTFFAALG